MASPFSRTLRSLQADRPHRRTAVILAAAAFIGAWLAWFALGRVAVYEVARRGRLEVEAAAHVLAAPLDGRIVMNNLAIGRAVRAGEVLVEFDAEPQRLALAEARARLEGLRSRLEATRREIQAHRDAALAHRAAAKVALEESRARLAEAQALAAFSEFEEGNLAKLRKDDFVSEKAFRKVKAEAEASRATVLSRELASSRIDGEEKYEQLDRAAAIAELERMAVELEAQAAIEEAAIRRLEYEIELRLVRAPVDGRVGKACELRPGSVLEIAGELGAIVPNGIPRVVAFFPIDSVGRIRPGQPARLRLEGFPWTRYGTPAATVVDVGNEPLDGCVRVELMLDPDSAPAIPREHGLPAIVEVEVERLSPAELVLRAAGRLLTTRRPDRPAAGGEEAR